MRGHLYDDRSMRGHLYDGRSMRGHLCDDRSMTRHCRLYCTCIHTVKIPPFPGMSEELCPLPQYTASSSVNKYISMYKENVIM